MPLIHKASKKILKKNIESEMEAHPAKEDRAQDLAIAYSVQRQARKKMAQGGRADADNASDERDEEMLDPDADRSGSIADRVMRKRMSEGGRADLQDNEDEQPDLYPELNADAVDGEYYDLDQLDDQPMDSNEHGHEIPEDEHDHIERIRARIRNRRGY